MISGDADQNAAAPPHVEPPATTPLETGREDQKGLQAGAAAGASFVMQFDRAAPCAFESRSNSPTQCKRRLKPSRLLRVIKVPHISGGKVFKSLHTFV